MNGSKGSLILNPGTTEEKRCKSKGVDQLKAGDVLSIQLPGSGGYGSPVQRDPEKVRWDVINGKISMASAQRDYLVILNQDLNVDVTATKSLRTRHRSPDERR
jgi:N-methylhydantoinase B